MNDIKRLKEAQKDKHPGFGNYLDCMTRSLFSGLATFCLSFSGLYFTQKVLQSKLKYTGQYNILVSTVISSGLAYSITSQRTKACQAGWMASEDKHTILKETEY